MATSFEPAPTYADPVIVDELTGKSKFNPIWLKWFLNVAQVFNSVGGTGINHELLVGLLGGADNGHFHITSTTATDLANGFSITVTLEKITPGGTQGSPTFTRGILTAGTAPT